MTQLIGNYRRLQQQLPPSPAIARLIDRVSNALGARSSVTVVNRAEAASTIEPLMHVSFVSDLDEMPSVEGTEQ